MHRKLRLPALSGLLAIATTMSTIASAGAPGAGSTPPGSVLFGRTLSAQALAGPAAALGAWSNPISEGGIYNSEPPNTKEESKQFPTAVSSVVLPNGKVLFWNGLEGLEDSKVPVALDGNRPIPNSRSRVLDLATMTFSVPTPEDAGAGDLFCADQRLLADGRVVAVGGTEWKAEDPTGRIELYGLANTRVYTPGSGSGEWTEAGSMNVRRWYPSLVTLPDGKLLVAGGVEKLVYNDKGMNVSVTETFDPSTLQWTENPASASTTLPLFARLRLLPNGKVFYDATGQMWSPAGEAVDEALWNIQKWYDPATQSWTDKGLAPFGARSGSFSAMLPLRPDTAGAYNKTEILIAGGILGTSPGTYLANSLTEKVTIEGDSITRERVADLNNRRWYSSGVVLPTGEVLAFSGADKDEVVMPGLEFAVRQPELYDPTSDTWTPLASPARERTYHNSAVLLPDGSVLVGGHSPIPAFYGPGNDNYIGPPFANNFKDPSFEIFRPPYLYRGDRPEIASAPRGIARGTSFTVQTSDASSVSKVVLSKLPAVTHITDADQRTVELPIVSKGDGSITLAASPSSSVLPSGDYYLFLIKGDGASATPSNAAIVRVGTVTDTAPALIPVVQSF